MRSAIPKDKSNSAFCSAGIVARQSRNNLFCIITIKFQRLHFSMSVIIFFSNVTELSKVSSTRPNRAEGAVV